MALKLVTAPAAKAVDLTSVKSYLRVSGSGDDTLLNDMIDTATQQVENFTSRRLINQTWRMFLDCFPHSIYFDLLPEGVTEGSITEYTKRVNKIEIPIFPLVSVTHLKTYDEEDTEETFDASNYTVDTASEPGRIVLKNSASWPTTTLRHGNGIEIEFIAGYGAAASSVPAALRQAVMDLVTFKYQNRGCDPGKIPDAVMAILNGFRVYRL